MAGSMLPTAAFIEPEERDSIADSELLLWYRQPAKQWIDGMPLGNGRLGAMVFGGTTLERIGLNEDTLWSGGPYDPAVNVPPATLNEIRQLVFEDKRKEAQSLADRTMEGVPHNQASYQTVGELRLQFPSIGEVSEYRRQLDLRTAIATVTYSAMGVRHTREVFATPIANVIVVRLSADAPGRITFDATFETPQKAQTFSVGQDGLRLIGQNGPMEKDGQLLHPAELRFEGRMLAKVTGGRVATSEDKLSVMGADSVVLLIAAATSYRSYRDVSGDPAALCDHVLQQAAVQSYVRLRREHIAAHRRIFGRVHLILGKGAESHGALSRQPTDERLRAFTLESDPAFASLYFQFGRYLLLSCSRKGGQPANLQGMWNQDLVAAWGGKYTLNINTEMNYWPTYATNMAECDEPLLDMVEDLTVTGARTAQMMYRASGWVCHHNTDLWRATAPIDGAFWGLWPMGGAWLCNQLFERYAFTLDRSHLKRLYPMMKGAARFFLDTLVTDPKTGRLVTCPSMSPEHERTHGITISAGPTMDMQILHQLFGNCMEAARSLGVDHAETSQWERTREHLAPMQIGKEGQLQEWLEDIDSSVPELNHRHMSPLYGLFPGAAIAPREPRLMASARKLMEMRGDTNGMGWALAWRVNLWARLGDGERAGAVLQELIGRRTESNLFDRPSVQLDGNFGGTSGITEMLLQSHTGEIHLLPALPSAWSQGSASGLLARGGLEIAMQWKSGQLQKATVKALSGAHCTVRYKDHTHSARIPAGKTIRLGPEMQVL